MGAVDRGVTYHGQIESEEDLLSDIGGTMAKFAKPFKSTVGLLRTRGVYSNFDALRRLCCDGAHNDDIDVTSETKK